MRLQLPHPCQPNCALCRGGLVEGTDALDTLLKHAEQSGQSRVYLQGARVASSPHLPDLVVSAKRRALHVALVEDSPDPSLARQARSLQQMGIAEVYVAIDGAADEPPGAAVRSQGRKQALAVLLALSQARGVPVGVHVALGQRAARELPAVLRLLARLSVRELLISDVTVANATDEPLDAAAALAALERAWLAAHAQQVRLHFIGFTRARYVDTSIGEPAPWCDSALLETIRRRFPLPSARAGIRAASGPDRSSTLKQLVGSATGVRQLGLDLSARQAPFVDLPGCLGGTQVEPAAEPAASDTTFIKADGCRTCCFDECCPGAPTDLHAVVPQASLQSALRPLPTWYALRSPPRVLILSSRGGDGLFYISTLPSLAETLRRRGATVEIVSPWLSRWTSPELPALDHEERAAEWMGTAAVEAWLETHDLGGFDLVITSDFPTARAALTAGALGAAARIVVLDFHMLETMDRAVAAWCPPGARAAEGGWWPSDQLVIESAFPAHVQLYRNYGVPLEHVAWRPFALHAEHFPPGPDVRECRVVFSGGDHLRDTQTLFAATALLSPTVHPVDLYAFGEQLQGNAHLRHQGSVSVQSFYRALANSRFAVLPLHDDSNCAAGITVTAMALMAGRPLVATGTAAVRDYVQHEAEALLVPPGDPEALAAAITRLDTDPTLLSALAEGAQRAGRRISTDGWAEQIVSGGRPPMPHRTPFGWRHW